VRSFLIPQLISRYSAAQNAAARRVVFTLREPRVQEEAESVSDGRLFQVTGARVLAHPQVVEYQTHVKRELSHFLRHTSSAFGFEHADGETAKPGDVFRAMAGTDATAILIIVPILRT
jgi:hypothetical protein